MNTVKNDMKPHRLNLIQDAITFNAPLEDLEKHLSTYPWDYDGAPAYLTRGHIENALSRFLQKTLTAEDLYQWAEFLELRDDVDYPQKDSALLSNLMHVLANPSTEGILTEEKASAILSALQKNP